MDNLPGGQEAIRYSTTRSWWTPTLLFILWLPEQVRSGYPRWWWLVDIVFNSLLLLVLYVFTHPTLTFSSSAITQHRGPFHVSIDLSDLQSVRVNTTVRRVAAIDPQTGERRPVIRFNYKDSNDWTGKLPVQGFYVRDSNGHHLTLNILRTGADRWGAILLSAIRDQPQLELGPRVMEALESITR